MYMTTKDRNRTEKGAREKKSSGEAFRCERCSFVNLREVTTYAANVTKQTRNSRCLLHTNDVML